jgi:hypothetical protein
VSSEIVAAGAGLIGAVIGATASLAGTLTVERQRARADRRLRLLELISDAIFSGDRTKAVQSKIWMSVVGSREDLRTWGEADSPLDTIIGMNRILLGVVNAERESQGLGSLELTDLMLLLVARGEETSEDEFEADEDDEGVGEDDDEAGHSEALATDDDVASPLRENPERSSSGESLELGLSDVTDPEAHEAARQRLSTFPEKVDPEVVGVLETLPPQGLEALIDLAGDELSYTGTRAGPGRKPGSFAYDSYLTERGLLTPRRDRPEWHVLSDLGREAARLLIADGEPPNDLRLVVERAHARAAG